MIESKKPVLFFDIDNCLYSKSKRIHEMMSELIDRYFEDHLSLTQKDANELHFKYYKQYGLALEGLVRHHKVDALEYNAKVDDALPLDEVLKPNPDLRELLLDIDRSKVRLWLFTNAYVTHGRRVVKILGIEDCFEGITFCDYGAEKWVCKPHKEAFQKAMDEAGVEEAKHCYFVDDSYINTKMAYALGWDTAHLVESDYPPPPARACAHEINDLFELRDIWPHLFKSRQHAQSDGSSGVNGVAS